MFFLNLGDWEEKYVIKMAVKSWMDNPACAVAITSKDDQLKAYQIRDLTLITAQGTIRFTREKIEIINKKPKSKEELICFISADWTEGLFKPDLLNTENKKYMQLIYAATGGYDEFDVWDEFGDDYTAPMFEKMLEEAIK